MIDRGAFAIYKTFIRNAVGTSWQKRDGQGRKLFTADGKPYLETPDEAAERRWRMMPELSRQRFRDEAAAMLEVV